MCQFPTAGSSIEWQISGTSYRSVNAGEGQIRREGRGNNTEALIIPALPQFNGTNIVCILYTIIITEPNGTITFTESAPAQIIIQGTYFIGLQVKSIEL